MTESPLGEGGNGIVVKIVSPNGEAIARKYCYPWIVTGVVYGREEDRVKTFNSFRRYYTRIRYLPDGNFELRYFGNELKLTGFYKNATDNSCRMMIHKVDKRNEMMPCFHYKIDSCVQILAASCTGILDMELLGKTAYMCVPFSSQQLGKLLNTICSACLSALDQNRIIVDIKLENICQTDKGEWRLVDIDDLPTFGEARAMEMSTYTANGLSNSFEKMAAAIIISVAIASGTLGKDEAYVNYSFDAREPHHISVLLHKTHARLRDLLPMPTIFEAMYRLRQAQRWAADLEACIIEDYSS